MKVFIFDDISSLTSNYHSGGGLVVIAADKEAAKALIAERAKETSVSDKEWAAVVIHDLASADVSPALYIFPDAGCC